MESSTRVLGTSFFGAGARFISGGGPTKFRMNHRLAHPGLISSTEELRRPSSALAIGDKYTSLAIHKCSRHCPTLHDPGCGCQLSCPTVRPATNVRALSSEASNSLINCRDHAGRE